MNVAPPLAAPAVASPAAAAAVSPCTRAARLLGLWALVGLPAGAATAGCRLPPVDEGEPTISGTGGRAGGSGGDSPRDGETSNGGGNNDGGASERPPNLGPGGSASGTGGNGASNAPGGGTGGGVSASDGGAANAGTPDAAAPLARGPTPTRPGHRFPFPQNRESSRCVYPHDYRNDDVIAAYEQWKTNTVTTDGAGGFRRVKRLPSDPVLEVGSTVSEGIAYGMMIAVFMDDQSLFDDLWKYSQLWLDGNGLMHWYINAAGTERLGTGAATDADEDIAFALIMADRQWGGQGSLTKSYMQNAREQIEKIWLHEVHDGKLIKPGDSWGDWSVVNISYFAPSYYRLFAAVDGNTARWDAVITTVYDTIDNALNAMNRNETNGLVPAWCTSDGVPNPNVFRNAPTHYQYDSCRTPFRVGLDWCWTGETRARDYVAKTSTFFSGIGVANIADGYELDGRPRPEQPGQRSAAFIGPAGVGAMSASTFQAFVNEAYAAVATRTLLAGGAYYEESWTVLSLLVMTGNFIDFTAY